MAFRVTLAEAVELDLPGRRSREIVAGAAGADSTLRLVEIDVPEAGAARRPPHWHPDSEEVIHVLDGEGSTWVDGLEFAMHAGDTIRIARGERHVTRNTGDKTLKMLCFFPAPKISIRTEETADG